jgi:hypothetical protein
MDDKIIQYLDDTFDRVYFKQVEFEVESKIEGHGFREAHILKALRSIKNPDLIEEAKKILKPAGYVYRGGVLGKPDLMSTLKRATAADYALWLKGYLERGGKVTHTRDYDFNWSWYIATEDFIIPDRCCGVDRFNIIVPDGVNVTHAGFDHCDVYYMDYRKDPSTVPLFTDVYKMLKEM